jgi:hypothetical protein
MGGREEYLFMFLGIVMGILASNFFFRFFGGNVF